MDWIDFLYDAGVLKIGTFKLKSGADSPYFLNFGSIDSGSKLEQMGDFFARAILEWELRPDLLFGPAYKGLPLAIATCMQYSKLSGRELPYGSFRKEAKAHGDAGPVLGRAPQPGQRIVMIDDVLTTSATKVEGMAEIDRFLGESGHFVAVVVGVDWLQKTPDGRLYSKEFEERSRVPIKAMTTTRKLMDGLLQRGKIDKEVHTQCLATLLA